MIVICINDTWTLDNREISNLLTIGKEYQVIKHNDIMGTIDILNDFGHQSTYYLENFITKEDYRNQRLEDIDI